jgi:hypothetical protein
MYPLQEAVQRRIVSTKAGENSISAMTATIHYFDNASEFISDLRLHAVIIAQAISIEWHIPQCIQILGKFLSPH